MPLITVTHSTGARGGAIAKQVAAQLDIDLYDDERLQKEALQLGMRTDELKKLDGKTPGLLDRLLSRRPQLYLDLLEALILNVAKSGNGVIVGHGSYFLLRNFDCAFHILVLASFEKRVKRFMRRKNLSRRSAEKLLQKHAEEVSGFLKYAFKIDRGNPSNFDLVINTDKMPMDLAVELIIRSAQAELFQSCSLDARDAMTRLSLSKTIQAELLRHNINRDFLHIEVPESGIVLIRGFPKDEAEQARIIDIINAHPGVKEVRPELRIVPIHGIMK